MQPYPRAPHLVLPGQLHGTGCLSARTVDIGFPTVVWRLCSGPGCGWVWVQVTPPVLAGAFGGCVLVRFVASSLFYRLGVVVFLVGLRFRLAYGTCVVACALLLHPTVSGVRCGRACSVFGFGCVRPLLGGCWGVSVLVRPSRVVSCTSWLGVLCGGACLWARPACSPLFLAGVCCVAWVLGLRLGCAPPFLVGLSGCVFFFVGCWLSLSRALWSLSPRPLSFWVGCWSFFFCVACVCAFWASHFLVGRCSWVGGASFGCVVPLCPFGGPAFGAFWLGGLAVSCGVGGRCGSCGPFSCPPPPPGFPFWGGLPVPPSAFPGLAHALARIQCGLPGCCWWLRSVWPCSGPMGRVGYVHVGLGAPSCRVRSGLCRLGGCARRLRVALG